ncbi:MAG: hypothetical protein VYD21_04125, partial [Candidatus Thermoplasmatota archaeon]|nr:hypothetical protein [Candidatus Thermoplasmatota archaeon]
GAARAPESIEMLEDASSKPAQMTEASTKNAAKIAFVVGIALFGMGLPLLIVGSTSTGEDKLAMLIPGAILSGVGAFLGVVASFILISSRSKSYAETRKSAPSIEIEEASVGESIRFRIKNPPNDKSAWVGIYPFHAQNKDHGEEGDGWRWLRDLRNNRASFPEKSEGRWSIRVFQDGGYTMVCSVEFDVHPKKERWWDD